MSILPDILAPNLKVVFCGTAASKKSAAAGAPYAGPGNRFWETLYTVGFIPRRLTPPEFRSVLDFSIGLTNLAPHTVGNDDILKPADFDAAGLRLKIERYTPKVLAFTSKRAAFEFYRVKKVNYGFQPELVGETRVFVLPSPSGAARASWDITHWRALSHWLKNIERS